MLLMRLSAIRRRCVCNIVRRKLRGKIVLSIIEYHAHQHIHIQAKIYVANTTHSRTMSHHIHSSMYIQWHNIIWLDTHLVRIYFVNWRQKCIVDCVSTAAIAIRARGMIELLVKTSKTRWQIHVENDTLSFRWLNAVCSQWGKRKRFCF